MSETPNIEHPAAFYLGRQLARPEDDPGQPLLLESADLVTHAVCVGMTGSGKTGLGIGLLEEAALDGVPSIVIDPKGDMGNLLLTFPDLSPADFEPWLNPDEAARKGLTMQAYAEKVATTWRNGLARDGQTPDRIARLRQAVEFRVYTPGSEAGLPISVLQTLASPQGLNWDEHAEALRERIQSAVSALLALVGIEADPVRSREHILLTNLIQVAWQEGRDLDLADLIRSVQKPPMSQLGVFDLNAFFPAKERMELAMALNAIIASPSFTSWLKGDALEPGRLFWGKQGRPRVSIFSMAHLDDRERFFFVTLLLEQLVAWMRAQPGATSLRALLYFDELFGYLPPYPKDPPSKRPLLTLLKQARAVGLGLILATQNPVDLDYKALSNAGVWFVGRLQTEQDKGRLLDGLMGVQTSGAPLDRGRLEATISALPGRTFLLNNVHQPGTVLFKTRWVMSYLRGPLTREQVRQLMDPIKRAESEHSSPETAPAFPDAAGSQPPRFCAQCGAPLPDVARFCARCGAQVEGHEPAGEGGYGASERERERAFKTQLQKEALPLPPSLEAYAADPPLLSHAVDQYFLPLRDQVLEARLTYEPVVLAEATVSLLDQRRGVDHQMRHFLALEPPPEGRAARWEEAESLTFATDELRSDPAGEALFASIPASVDAAPKLSALKKQLADHLYVNSGVTLFYHPDLDLYSQVGEDQPDFQARLREAAEDQRDREVEKIKERYETRIDRAEERLRQGRHQLSDAEADYAARKRDETLSAAETVLGFLGRRRSSTALSKASSKRRMTTQARHKVEQREEQITAYEKELEELQREMQKEIEALNDQWGGATKTLEEFRVRPRRADVQISFVALGWRPVWRKV